MIFKNLNLIVLSMYLILQSSYGEDNTKCVQDSSSEYILTSFTRIPDDKYVSLTSGKTLTYFNWYQGQPNGGKEECIALYLKNSELQWHDVSCWNKYYFICEVVWTNREEELLHVLNTTLQKQIDIEHNIRTHCNLPLFLELFGLRDTIPTLNLYHRVNKSYYIGNIFKGNVLHAEQFCRYHDMSLVNIETQEENNFLEEKLLEADSSGEEFWTSGTKIPDSRKWIWFTTGRKISYFNWLKGQPDSNKNSQCIEAQVTNDQLQWSSKDCWKEYYFICEAARLPDLSRVEYS
ncbi:unnamed protein product [Diabrotica balteata]|uniref:C-type lectin domain-containing protein n=1 Tax=Diabrotica balteata TaxID=107213 RepID=A0A9N9SY36_DIABA|nr:unnamed protein product [Diabrotica balteata]